MTNKAILQVINTIPNLKRNERGKNWTQNDLSLTEYVYRSLSTVSAYVCVCVCIFSMDQKQFDWNVYAQTSEQRITYFITNTQYIVRFGTESWHSTPPSTPLMFIVYFLKYRPKYDFACRTKGTRDSNSEKLLLLFLFFFRKILRLNFIFYVANGCLELLMCAYVYFIIKYGHKPVDFVSANKFWPIYIALQRISPMKFILMNTFFRRIFCFIFLSF